MEKTNKKLIGIILIISLFICVGFAQIGNINLNITGKVDAIAQTEVFITEAKTTSSSSKVNYFTGTMLDTTTVLGTSASSTVSYDVTLYNSSEKDYIFIDVLTFLGAVTGEDGFYSNTNIDYTLTGLEKGKTIIPKKSSLTFTITFKYAGTNTTNNILESKVNFRFREVPVLNLSNENEEYILQNIYPDYAPAEYKFTVGNQNDSIINNVEMRYNFVTTIDDNSPLTVKIYDEAGNEVKENITINGEGSKEIRNKYTLKVIWDNTKGANYNSADYANKDYTCNVKLIAVPTNADYGEYNIEKEFNIKIKTAAFYLNSTVSSTDLTASNNQASTTLTVNNYNSSTEYNKYETQYELALKDTSKYAIEVQDGKNGKIATGANTNDVTVIFKAKDGVTLDEEESVVLILKAKKPYIYTKELATITINNYIPVQSVVISAPSDVLEIDDGMQLTATVVPENATNPEVTWRSSDLDLAEIEDDGYVYNIDCRLYRTSNNICRSRWCCWNICNIS